MDAEIQVEKKPSIIVEVQKWNRNNLPLHNMINFDLIEFRHVSSKGRKISNFRPTLWIRSTSSLCLGQKCSWIRSTGRSWVSCWWGGLRNWLAGFTSMTLPYFVKKLFTLKYFFLFRFIMLVWIIFLNKEMSLVWFCIIQTFPNLELLEWFTQEPVEGFQVRISLQYFIISVFLTN